MGRGQTPRRVAVGRSFQNAWKLLKGMAGTTGLEPATSDVTGRRSNQLNYVPANLAGYRHGTTAPPGSTNFRLFALLYVYV